MHPRSYDWMVYNSCDFCTALACHVCDNQYSLVTGTGQNMAELTLMVGQNCAMSSTTEPSSEAVTSLMAGSVLPTRTTSAPSLRSSLTQTDSILQKLIHVESLHIRPIMPVQQYDSSKHQAVLKTSMHRHMPCKQVSGAATCSPKCTLDGTTCR